MILIDKINRYISNKISNKLTKNNDELLLLIGKSVSMNVKNQKNVTNLEQIEFKVFSQYGDDGIIQWLINNIEIENKTFIEFGVSDYNESNTKFLLMNNNWSGFILDGSMKNINTIINSDYYWKYDLEAKCEFIDCDNINDILALSSFNQNIGILHIDLDGNDYWVLKKIININPEILILEYNSVFGYEKAITVPYDKLFDRTEKHFSNLYFGASLPALRDLCNSNGYTFIGCNSAGNNAYFIRNDKINSTELEKIVANAIFISSKFRENRGPDGKLFYINNKERQNIIKGLPVFNTRTNLLENL